MGPQYKIAHVTGDAVLGLVEESFRAGMADYREHIRAHWPSTQGADLDESNLTLHFARHLAERGVLVYSEVWAESVNGYLDLFALDREHRWALALESKRLKDGASARRLGEQIAALGRLELAHESKRQPRIAGARCLVAALAHTWGGAQGEVPPIARWWEAGRDRAPVPGT